MNSYLVILFLSFIAINNIFAQKVGSINFDSQKGEYVIHYQLNGNTTKKGFFVPGNGIKPFTKASVSYNSDSQDYIYNFELSNKKGAYHPLYAFELNVNAPIQGIKSFSDQWSGRYIEQMSKIRWTKTRGRIPGISPGETKSGFQFLSKSTPTIQNAEASSLTDIYFPDIDEELPYEVDVVVDSLRRITKHVTLQTIGPREFPKNISNAALADTLQHYLSFSCDTTWIANQGICRSLEAKLENVQRQLKRGNNSAASGSLQAFLNEVEALREKQLSSEAYALLWFNGQYLLERL